MMVCGSVHSTIAIALINPHRSERAAQKKSDKGIHRFTAPAY